jgi:anti-sigma factor RsiW
MADCERILEEASAMLDGELPGERHHEVAKHLEACETCRRTVSQWERFNEAAKAVGEPDPAHWEPVWAHIETAAVQRRSMLRLRREVRKGFFVATIAAGLLMAAYFLVPGQPVTGPVVSKLPEVETVDVEVAPGYTFTVVASEDEGTSVVWVESI